MGYPNVVAALLTSQLVIARINDADEMGVTPWIAANLSMRQSLWTCNPAVFDDPFKFVPMLVTQPYYLSGAVPPYKKAREVVEKAGAASDVIKAKEVWITNARTNQARRERRCKPALTFRKLFKSLARLI